VRFAGVPSTRLAFVARHHLRHGPPSNYVDPARAHLNAVLFGQEAGDFKATAHHSP
jgi:hypothetical protein